MSFSLGYLHLGLADLKIFMGPGFARENNQMTSTCLNSILFSIYYAQTVDKAGK